MLSEPSDPADQLRRKLPNCIDKKLVGLLIVYRCISAWNLLHVCKYISDGLDCPDGEAVLVKCESSDYEYQVCPVGDGTTVIDSVDVVEKQSISQCNFFDGNYLKYVGPNGDYGFTSNILWVDNGCRASFNVCSGIITYWGISLAW